MSFDSDLVSLMWTLQLEVASQDKSELMSVTRNAQHVEDVDDGLHGLRGSSFWGFMRSARLEAPRLKLYTIDLSAEAAVEEEKVLG